MSMTIGVIPGEHIQEGLNDLLCEWHSHLHPQALDQSEEEAQHVVSHIWDTVEGRRGITKRQSPPGPLSDGNVIHCKYVRR